MMASHVKELLVVNIQGQADWRTRKAEEYPEDERNARCSVALSRLAESVEAISNDHPLFQRLERLANTLSDDEIYQKLEYGEENRLIRRYGFDSPADDGSDPERFLTEVIEIYVKALERRGLDRAEVRVVDDDDSE